MDDEVVTAMCEEDVLRRQAYILYYNQESTPQDKGETRGTDIVGRSRNSTDNASASPASLEDHREVQVLHTVSRIGKPLSSKALLLSLELTDCGLL